MARFFKSGIGPEDPIAGIRGDAQWENAWLSAIALAWSSPELQKALIEDPKAFLEKELKYKVPDGLTLVVKESDAKDEEGNPTGWDNATRLWYLNNSEVVMYIPRAPVLEQQPLALSAYAATGRTYPFTCG